MKTVIMAGGSGSRLWPLSRSLHPKQFLPLVDDTTMLQATIQRAEKLSGDGHLIICNEEHRFIAAEQARAIGAVADILLEPVGRNTAPAIALAALEAMAEGDDPLLLVLAADHVITDSDVFCQQVEKAKGLAEQGLLVTFGIVPNCPETGYGYIRCGSSVEAGFNVSEFVEKPDLPTAEKYVKSGEYLWNSGMFLFRASRYLEELQKYCPEIFDRCKDALQKTAKDMDFIRIDAEAFSQCPDDSIDYAVMEKTDAAVVVPLDAGWSDVGNWSSLWDVLPKDNQANVVHGDVITHNTENTLINSTGRMVAAIGIKDAVIVETADVVLVASKDQVQDVKHVVERLKAADRAEVKSHREVYRPWGKYDSIDKGERYQVKRITVLPGRKLSLQMHHHRAEHWVIVSGMAKVYNGNEERFLNENESIYIPVGTVHSLENPGKIPLELIEVQSGSYLGEDDIVRLEDSYGRV